MIFSIRLLAVLLVLNFSMANQVLASSVFANKNKAAHELSSAEQQSIQSEFDSKFASAVSSKVNSKDPWAKKNKSDSNERTATWGECRESALRNRFGCYRDKKAPYQCERLYEARIHLCDDNL
ncbi:MAG: hypothetical protein OEZ38_04420 [Gammaproteobacteria bacterium]|nr:hypothetical protein [Gammaproteobacteria bacterium]